MEKITRKFGLISLILGTAGCSVLGLKATVNKKESRTHFTVKDCVVYYDGKAMAKYQAKTFSLDGGELVEEYNLLMIDRIIDKQRIGDLIDFISDRHPGAEVEVELDPKTQQFEL